MDWRSKAACLSVDPELFFPIGNTGPAIAQAAEAKTVCRECVVQAICLQWALDNNPVRRNLMRRVNNTTLNFLCHR